MRLAFDVSPRGGGWLIRAKYGAAGPGLSRSIWLRVVRLAEVAAEVYPGERYQLLVLPHVGDRQVAKIHVTPEFVAAASEDWNRYQALPEEALRLAREHGSDVRGLCAELLEAWK